MSEHGVFMKRAIGLAREGMAGGHGGPFGAVIVRDGKIVGEGHNRVLSAVDPTAHAEVTAIRDAARKEGRFDLSGCEIYVNGLPCPMCMSAIFWARIGKVYYACAPEDAEKIGFDDQEFYRQLGKPPAERATPAIQLTEYLEEARDSYNAWLARDNRVPY
ncbi:MAG: nucleoside deaminase [Proteobacteria bacterium]|nr:nucleoside deaminase [Pseudomonadota bacterium]MBU6425890.1 nucleoside deaminase [Rhodospirillales bacterium]